MKRAPQAPSPPVTAASGKILQLKVWLMNISPMVWRRLLVPVDCTLRELHGLLQVAMGWQGFHLYQFRLRAVRYGCSALSTRSSGVPLSALGLRKGSYRATLNSDDTLRYALTYRFLDAAGADNGLYRTATYVLSRSGRLTPQTVDAFGTYGATSTPSQFRGTYTGYRY